MTKPQNPNPNPNPNPQAAPQAASMQKLSAVGVTDPAHQATAQHLLGMGFGVDEILHWVRTYRGDILEVIQIVLDKVKAGGGVGGGGVGGAVPPGTP